MDITEICFYCLSTSYSTKNLSQTATFAFMYPQFFHEKETRKTNHEAMVVHVQNQVLPHDSEADQANVRSAKQKIVC